MPATGKVRYYRYVDKDGKTIIRDAAPFGDPKDPNSRLETIRKLKDAGIESVFALVPGSWDLVCEELCGQGHGTMRGEMIVVSPRQYINFIYHNEPPTTQPVRTIASNNDGVR